MYLANVNTIGASGVSKRLSVDQYYLSFEINDYLQFNNVISYPGDFFIEFVAVFNNYDKIIGGNNSTIETRGTNQIALNIPARKVFNIPHVFGDKIKVGRRGSDLYARVNDDENTEVVLSGQASSQTCNFQYVGRDHGGDYAVCDFYTILFNGNGEVHDFDIANTDGLTVHSKTSSNYATNYGATRIKI